MRQPKSGGGAECLGDGFWRFSLALYARPGVAEALIALQDRAGRDVNLILFALWTGVVHSVRLDSAGLAAADAAIAGLRDNAVEPLRALRRRLKAAPGLDSQELRRRVLATELAAERRVQFRLAAWLMAWAGGAEPDRSAAAEANLAVYLGGEAQSHEAALLREALAALVRRS
jgi:uncharacterized protein (TIGR02444 family)